MTPVRLALASFLFALGCAHADEPVVWASIKHFTDAIRETANQLDAISDSAAARKAGETLQKTNRLVAELNLEWKKVGTVNQTAAAKDARAAIAELEVSWARIVDHAEWKTCLEKLPDVASIVADQAARRKPGLLSRNLTDLELAKTRMDAQMLGLTTIEFKIEYGKLPESLQQMLAPPNGGKPLLAKEDLFDQWGRPFQYDPKGSRCNGKNPDVWSIGLDANDPKCRLGNWATSPETKNDN